MKKKVSKNYEIRQNFELIIQNYEIKSQDFDLL